MPLDSLTLPPTPQQAAADPFTSAFVTANAGSGKTSTLVQRVARLLLHGARPDAVLCVTYTKAAAAEMQRRLYGQLGGWAVADNAALRRALADIGEDPDVVPASRARKLFAQALETPGGLKIQTIHAFCEKLLRRFPLEAGVSPGFRVAEGPEAEALSADARVALAHLVLDEPGGPVATAYEHFAVELAHTHFDDLLRVLEGKREQVAGLVSQPGYEATVWRRCGFADGAAVDPDALRAEAASPPALDVALWRRLAEALESGGAANQKEAARLREAIRLGEEGHADFEAVWCALFTDKGERRFCKKPPRVLTAAGLLGAVEAEQGRLELARERACAATVARDTVHALTIGAAYGRAYEKLKAARGALDFADLVHRTHELLTRRADAAWVLYKLDGGIDHVLVDEAQDTAPEQWDILRALTGEFFSGSGALPPRDPDRTVFAVGDEKQSIYSFQGARPERLRAELQDYSRLVTGAERAFRGVALEESWRSTPEVLSYVDAVFAPAEMRAAVPAPEGHNVLHHIPRRADHGCVDLWPLEQDVAAPERDAWDKPLDAEPVESARKRLARKIAALIKSAVERGEAVGDKGREPARAARWDDFLILVRRRDALFEEIIRALKMAGVPVGGADRLKLSEHILFDDLLALARVALFPGDDLKLAALLRSPFFDIDEDGLYALARGRSGSLWGALRDRAGERPAWAAAHAALFDAMRATGAAQPYGFYAKFLALTDAEGRSMTARLLTRLGREAEDALEAFLGEAIAAEARGVLGLEAFAAALERSELEVKREQDEGRGEVRVMTVHGAKGLEAPIVILPDTTVRAKPQGVSLLPDGDGGFLYAPRKADDCDASAAARALREAETDRESLRLLYVALTRARDRLIICGRVGAKAKDGAAEAGSWYAHCLAAFDAPAIAGLKRTITASNGAPVVRFGEDPGAAAQVIDAREKHMLPEWARRTAPHEHAAAAYASPSQLTAQARRSAPSPLSERGGLGRYRRGDLIHGLLQALPDLPPEGRAAAAERIMRKHADLTDDQRTEMIGAAMTVLDDPIFAEVFGPGSRAEAAVAGTAPGLPRGLSVSGRVDRMVVTPERVLVVDFKTNRPSPDRIEDADEAYLAQMAVYVAVLRAVFPRRRVEAALVWTDGPKLMPVPDNLVEATLAALPGAR